MNNSDNLKIPRFELKAPKRISPSQFTAIQNCALREVLKKSISSPLLPPTSAALLGNIIHKMIELIAKGKIRNRKDFMFQWDELVDRMEEKLIERGLKRFTPLKRTTPYFAIKKLQTLEYLNTRRRESVTRTNNQNNLSSEEWFQSKDGTIGGYIDLILKKEKTKLIDFKTGQIFEDEALETIKSAYEIQLKLYAWLYKEKMGNYPDEIILATLSNNWHHIAFKPMECEDIAIEAKRKLREVQQLVENKNMDRLAAPKYDVCRFCKFKPACPSYWQLDTLEDSFSVDLRGLLKSVKKNYNGKLSFDIVNGKGKYHVINFRQHEFSKIKSLEEREIQVFNLRKMTSSGVFTAVKNTKIYIYEN